MTRKSEPITVYAASFITYLNAIGLVVAALPPALTAFSVVPMLNKNQLGMSVFVATMSYCVIALVFFCRHAIGRALCWRVLGLSSKHKYGQLLVYSFIGACLFGAAWCWIEYFRIAELNDSEYRRTGGTIQELLPAGMLCFAGMFVLPVSLLATMGTREYLQKIYSLSEQDFVQRE